MNWRKITVAVVAAGALIMAGAHFANQIDQPKPAPTTTSSSSKPVVSETDALSNVIRGSMQDKLNTDPELAKYNLSVVQVGLVKKGGNEYVGTATVRTWKGTERQVPVQVTYDGANAMWQVESGGFSFAAADGPQP